MQRATLVVPPKDDTRALHPSRTIREQVWGDPDEAQPVKRVAARGTFAHVTQGVQPARTLAGEFA